MENEEIICEETIESTLIEPTRDDSLSAEIEKTIEAISAVNIDETKEEIEQINQTETQEANEKNEKIWANEEPSETNTEDINENEKPKDEEVSTSVNSTSNKLKEKKKKEVDPSEIPRKGYFFEHDDRDGEEKKSEQKSKSLNKTSTKQITTSLGEENGSETNVQLKNNRRRTQKKRDPRQNSENNIDRWQHDKFDLIEQKPKSKQDIIKRYGYDIREEKDNNSIQKTNNNIENNRKITNKLVLNSNAKNRENLSTNQRRHSQNFDNEFDEEDRDRLQRNLIINNDDEKINLSQLRRRKPNVANSKNNHSNNNNNYNKNRYSLNVDSNRQPPKTSQIFENSQSKLKNLPNNNNNNNYQRQQQNQSNFKQRIQSDSNAQTNKQPLHQQQDNLVLKQQYQQFQQDLILNSDLKTSIDQELPKRYSTIRSNQRPLNAQIMPNKLFTNQQSGGVNLDQVNFQQHQFIFNSNNHSPVQHQQPQPQQQPTWPNAPRALTNHMQMQNNLQQHLNLQPPPGLSLNTQSTSNGSTSVSQQQMATLINNQLYYMQPNDYMTQLTAAQEYATAMAVLQTNPIYFNQSLTPSQQQQPSPNTMSPMSQLGIQRQSKAIPIVNPHQFNQRNF